jgi:glycine betaine catabolism B
MNNNDNKKSSKSWTHRLFKQPSAADTTYSKCYFAHRYHDEHKAQTHNPFGALFSVADNKHTNLEHNTTIYQASLRDNSLVSEDNSGIEGHFKSHVSNPSITKVNGFDHQSSEALSSQFTVLNCYDETRDTKTFRLGRLNAPVFNYLPGQYITLTVVIDGREYKRSYSLASSPNHSSILDITVKRDPNGGVVSNWLNDHLKIGDPINVKGPFGKFSCAKNIPKKVLFIAAGSGIVPIMSMLRWLTETEAPIDIVLLLSFRTLYDIIYSDELNLIAARHKNIKLFITLTQEPLAFSQWQGLAGRINENLLAGLVPDLPERVVYLCGPDAFMAECKQNLKLPAEQLICESFTVNSPAVITHEPIIDQPAIAQSPSIQASRRKTGNYKIKFAKSHKTIAADGAMTLLEIAEKSGININHECRAGECGECMIKCLKGKVEMTEQAEIDDVDRKKGWVYSCCAYPVSNAVLDV